MRSLLLSLLVACTLAACISASAQTAEPVAPQIVPPVPPASPASASKSADTKPADSKHDYSQEAFVVEQLRSSYRFENDGTGRKETVARIRVQSEAGVQQWGQIQLGYNSANERVEIAYVRVVKADGSVVKAGDDAVQDLSAPVEREAPVYTDFRVKHITV